MSKAKTFLLLHFCVGVFSLTGVLQKLAATEYNTNGLGSLKLYMYVFLMFVVCAIFALAWQRVIKYLDLNIAYANKSVYLIWGQVWAVALFGEHLTIRNIVGLAIAMAGVIVVSLTSEYDG